MAPKLRHPSSKKLLRWLESGESDKVQAHVEQCERCADRLVILDKEETGGVGEAERSARHQRLAQLLSEAFSAPDDLNERVVEGVQNRSKTEAELMLLAGLMAVGFDTARFITNTTGAAVDDGENRNRRYGREGRTGADDATA